MAECAAFAFADWVSTLGALADAESRMLAVLDELGPTGLVTTIPGLSAVGAAVIYGSRGRGCPGVTAQVTATPPAMRAYPARCGYHR